MANRLFNHSYGIEKQVIHVYAHVTFGASGAPTLDVANSKGVKSITRNSAGNYTIVFGNANGANLALDSYKKLLAARCTFLNGSAIPAAPFMYVVTDSSGSASASIVVQFAAATSSSVTTLAATDPASGDAGYFEFNFGNSSSF